MKEQPFTLDALREIMIDQIGLAEKDVPATPDARISSLMLDSLTLVQLQILIKHLYGVEFDEDVVENLDTVGDVIEFINQLRAN